MQELDLGIPMCECVTPHKTQMCYPGMYFHRLFYYFYVHHLTQKQKLTHSLRYLFAFFDMNVYHILICWRLLTLQFTTYHLLTYGVMPLGF